MYEKMSSMYHIVSNYDSDFCTVNMYFFVAMETFGLINKTSYYAGPMFIS